MVEITGTPGHILAQIRARYPGGVPQRDYQHLISQLAQRLSPKKVRDIAAELVVRHAHRRQDGAAAGAAPGGQSESDAR